MSPMTPISPISKTMNTTLKYLYFALAIVALSACQVIPENEQMLESFTPADTSQIKRTSLLIEYSGWRCMNCPNAATVAHDLQEQYGEELVVVVMHPASNPNTRYGNNQSVNYTCPEAVSVYIRMGGTNATPFPTGNINFLQQDNSFFCGSDTWATLLSRYYGSSPIIMKQTLAHENNTVGQGHLLPLGQGRGDLCRLGKAPVIVKWKNISHSVPLTCFPVRYCCGSFSRSGQRCASGLPASRHRSPGPSSALLSGQDGRGLPDRTVPYGP